MNAGIGWRIISLHERIKKGDELLDSSGGWLPTTQMTEGLYPTTFLSKTVRRRSEEPTAYYEP